MWAEMQSEINDSDAGSAQKVQHIKKVEKAPEAKKVEISDAKCPECGETLTHEGGCDICKNCGYSKCN
jgi:ribonucleoside-diphosphate reductase alpha chain